MGSPSALKEVLSASARQISAGATADAAEQLDLLPEVVSIDRFDQEKIRANGIEERRRGRPKGAENLSSRQVREMIFRECGIPLLALARWASLTPEELALRLGCSKLEAFDRWKAMNSELASFTQPRLAPTDDKGQAVPMFVQVVNGQPVTRESGARPPWEYDFDGEAATISESVENQGLSDGASEKSHSDKSHEAE